MLASRRAVARKLAALAGGLSLFALAAQASAATQYSTIWIYYDHAGHVLGDAGLNCDGGVFEYDGDLPDGGYVRRVTHRCDVGSTSVVCYGISAISGTPKLTPISCSQIPGFGSY